ncbi:MAG: YegS/Rv2252/BmrU family lipid kinase [Ruminococcus sp.]|nr:YegS/Rv2252/BmrU family lipid kinase [Ruminococcus sp.]
MSKILFIYNPISGKGLIKGKLSYIIENLSELGTVTVLPTKSKGDATRFVISNMNNFDMIVCSGGDGTLNEVTTGYMSVEAQLRKPCAYIPAGTVNDFATSLGISKNITKCVDAIPNSMLFPYDIGEFNGRYFNYIAGFGAFTEVAYSTPQNIKNILGKLAYFLEGIKQLSKIKSIHINITANNITIENNFIYGMICNTFSVGGLLKINERSVELDDGKFEAIFVKSPTNPIDLQETINDLLTGKTESKHLVYIRDSNFTINSDSAIAWTLDGEFGGETSTAVITNHARAIAFLKPQIEE